MKESYKPLFSGYSSYLCCSSVFIKGFRFRYYLVMDYVFRHMSEGGMMVLSTQSLLCGQKIGNLDFSNNMRANFVQHACKFCII